MQSTHIQLVQASFQQVNAIADQAAALFYENLFRLDPSLRPLFRGDMQAQGRKLMQMIGVAVSKLEHPEQLLPALRQLGARHHGYGVTDGHYETVGQALLQTLAQGLGAQFTDAVRQAWQTVYRTLADEMKAAAKPLPVAAA